MRQLAASLGAVGGFANAAALAIDRRRVLPVSWTPFQVSDPGPGIVRDGLELSAEPHLSTSEQPSKAPAARVRME